MLKLGRVTKVKVLFLVLVFVFNFDLFKFSAAILEKGLFHSLRTYRTSESNIEKNCMVDKSKSSVQGTKSTQNGVFTTELNKCVHESKQCTYAFSVYPYRTGSSVGQRCNH